MRRRRMLIMGFILLLLVAAAWYISPMLQIASGYAAKMSCSCIFLQGRSLDEVRDNDLNFSILPYVLLSVDEAGQRVHASLLGLARREAHYIPGRGCVLVSDDERPLPAPVRLQPPRPDALLPWPHGEALPDSLPAGIDTTALEAALDFGLRPLPGGGARGIVVVYDGQLIGERYAPGFGPATPQLGWSMTKSLTNALTGLLVKQGRLRLDQDHLFPAWADDERRQITVTHLLHMNSGLDWNEDYGRTSGATTMLYRRPDMAAYAAEQPLAHPPGTVWRYSSGTSNLLSELLQQQFADEADYLRFIQDSLFTPLGMHTALIETDQAGTPVGSSYGWATPRDWARFGLLYLQDGRYDGRQILPAGWVDFSREPAPGSDYVYGAHIWLPDTGLPDAPEDTFIFRGFQDQRVFIVPSRRLVLVRTGTNEDKAADFNELLKRVLAAID